MTKEKSKTDRVTFITEKSNWLKAGGIIQVKVNKTKDVAQLYFENGKIAEIHAFDAGENYPALVVGDLASLDNVQAQRSAGATEFNINVNEK